jgi:hypothetical protein
MRLLKRYLPLSISLILLVSLSSCSKVLSHRTDEQAWSEFDQEVRLGRAPAAFTETHDPSLSSLHEALTAIPVRSILLKCGDTSILRTCFQSALTLQFDEIFRASQAKFPELKLGDYKREQKAFFDFRSFETTVDEVNRFHQSILSGLDLKAREHALELFKSCEGDATKNTAIESFKILSTLVSEMPKGTYACLTDHWFTDQNQLLEETSDRLGLSIVTDEAKHWIKDQQISPIYDSEINTTVSKKAREEADRFSKEKAEIMAGFDAKTSQEKLLKEWSVRLREKFPYSPVEQWIIGYAKEHS